MNSHHDEHVVPTGANAVHRVLLDVLALPEWNPAFHSVEGPANAPVGTEYRIRVRPGLTGTLVYTHISTDRIDMTWQVPGFRETGSWTLRPRGTVTLVGHEFEHAGALATILEPAYQNVAGLRLRRLEQRLRDEPAGYPR